MWWILLACSRPAHEHQVPLDAAAQRVELRAGAATNITTKAGSYQISFKTDPAPIPLSRLFSIDAVVTDSGGAPVTDATLDINATMPQHGHGMSTKPENIPGTCDASGVCAHPLGQYRTEGMKFHMPGDWTMSFKVESSRGNDEAVVVVTL